MKKFLLLLVLFSLVFTFSYTVTAQTPTNNILVFKVTFNGNEYNQLSTANIKKKNQKKAYIIMDYNSVAYTFATDPEVVKIITYWMENSNKIQLTEDFGPTLSVNTVNSGLHVLGKETTNAETNKDFQAIISQARLQRVRQISEGYAVPTELKGTTVYEVINSLGERTIGSAKFNAKLNLKWSDPLQTIYNPYTITTAVAALESHLSELGYKKYEPETDDDDDDNN